LKPKFIFTLGGDLGDHVISEPEGWASIIFNLERDPVYWSLIENFELPLIFYGTSEGNDGGYNYLKSAITNGIDSLVTIDIQVSFDDGDTYELCFDGRIDLSTAKETIYRTKIQAAIVRNDIWAQFMANKSKPVDLLSSNDIYGNPRIQVPTQVLNLPSQKIFSSFIGNYSLPGAAYPYSFLSDGFDFGIIDFDDVPLSEIKDKYDLPADTAINVDDSFLFELEYGGDYSFTIKIYGQVSVGIDILGNFFDVILKAGTNTITLSKTNSVIAGPINITTYSYAGTLTLAAGNLIQLYFSAIMPGIRRNAIIYGTVGGIEVTYMNITANTIYTDTDSDTVLIHDAGLSICDRILGKDDSFYSELFGGLNSAFSYSENGCGYLNALTRGLNIRGYRFDEKPFTLNFDDYWAGINSIFNLGLGYEGTNEQFDNSNFQGSFSPWLQHGNGSFQETWAWISNGQIRSDGSLHGDNFRDSYYFYQENPLGWEKNNYNVHFKGRNDSTGPNKNELFCQIYTSNDGFLTPILQVSSGNIPLGDFNLTLQFVLSGTYTGLGFIFSIGAPTNVGIVTLYSAQINSIIRIERKSYFFNIIPIVYLTGINDIETEFDLGLYTKTIEIGCETWQAESISGIDDPQTKHTYNLRYQLFGKDEKQLSKFIAASLAIEQTRRLTKVQSQDWRLDENIFIIALSDQDSPIVPETSPPTITQQPELISSGITGLTNSETKYNVRHTPARFIDRWSDFYSGQMQSYLGDTFKFGSGEGNILMSWTGDGGCDSGALTENQNIPISSNYLFLPIVYLFTHPLTWDEYVLIRNNRKNAISISWELEGVIYTKIAFIKKLGYDINKSKGTFEVWIRS